MMKLKISPTSESDYENCMEFHSTSLKPHKLGVRQVGLTRHERWRYHLHGGMTTRTPNKDTIQDWWVDREVGESDGNTMGIWEWGPAVPSLIPPI